MNNTVAIIDEALALERAGMTWAMRHVAALCDRSASFIANSSCPKHTEEAGPRSRKGRGKVVFIPAEVRKWKADILDKNARPRMSLSA